MIKARTPQQMLTFFSKSTVLDPGKGCWLWTGGKDKDGYGQTSYRGKNVRAHRVSWSLHNNAELPSLCVMHSCDTPACINPAHLSLGTGQENNEDKMQKGRHHAASGDQHYMRKTRGIRAGTKSPTAKLNEQQVASVLQRISAGETQRSIARDFGVSRTCISAIAIGRTWKLPTQAA